MKKKGRNLSSPAPFLSSPGAPVPPCSQSCGDRSPECHCHCSAYLSYEGKHMRWLAEKEDESKRRNGL